jgi:hypothetical protein
MIVKINSDDFSKENELQIFRNRDFLCEVANKVLNNI